MIKYFAILKVKEIFQRWFENFLKSQSVTRLDFTSRKKVVRLLSERIICMQGSRTENYIFTVEKCSSLENSLSSPVYAYVSFLLSSTTIYIYIYVGAEQLFHFQQPLFSDPYTVHLVNAFSPTALQPYSSSGIRYPFYRIQQVMFYPKLSKIFISLSS